MMHIANALSCPDGPIRRLPAGLKIFVAIVLILVSVCLPGKYAWGLSIVAAFLGVVLAISRIPLRRFIVRLLILEPFVVGVTVLSFFQPNGWRIGLLLIVRCTLCIAVAIILSATTEVSQMVSFLRAVKIPSLLITTMLLMHRYLFVLIEESQKMKRARSSRTFQQSRRLQWRSLSTVISQLFIRALERADRVYAAMCARGWR